ncbi:hypothetical protein GCM10028807_17430 [Spirosoma daeguense]
MSEYEPEGQFFFKQLKTMYTFSTNNLAKAVQSQSLPEIEVFQHINFNFQTDTVELQPGQVEIDLSRGKDSFRTSFNVDLKGHSLDKNISAIIIYSGYWQFFDSDGKALGSILGPGHYARVSDFGIPNDQISSFRCVSLEQLK